MKSKDHYNAKMENLKKMLKEIEAGLESHEDKAKVVGKHWGYVGDLAHFEENLGDVRDCLLGLGEYAD